MTALTMKKHYASHLTVPGTAAIRRRCQLMKTQVEVKSMNHRPAAAGHLLVDLMHFVQLNRHLAQFPMWLL